MPPHALLSAAMPPFIGTFPGMNARDPCDSCSQWLNPLCAGTLGTHVHGQVGDIFI
jgi:hypothetical protein